MQIDPGDLEDFQRAARLLLAHPIVTRSWPDEGALALVRRWEVPLAHELNRVFGYRLDVGRTCARLYRRSASLSVHRGPTLRTGRSLGRWTCSLLCLALAAIESLGEQTTLSALAEEILRLRSGDDELPIDLTQYDQRRALADAVGWLEERGVATLRDGTADRWLKDAEEGDALYDLDRDAASRLLVASPSVLRDVEGPRDFLVDPYPPTAEGDQARLRHRLARRLVTEPVVLYADLAPDELAHVRQRRSRIVDGVQRLTGATVEARAEGMSLIDPVVAPLSAEAFPSRGSEAHAALLWGTALAAAVAEDPDDAEQGPSRDRPGSGAAEPPRLASDVEDPPVPDASLAGAPGADPDGFGPVVGSPAPAPGRVVDAGRADAEWDAVVAAYRDRFAADYRADPDRLRVAAIALLERFGLVVARPDGSLVVHAVLARYRPAVTLAASAQLSLLDEGER
ncbi:MAG: TIGR02678 family protein [Iamia sp.]